MKVFVLLCFVGAAFAVREPEVYTCIDRPDPGRCLAYVPSYYYDPETDTCRKFIYGGCGGNGNRYPTEEACLENCRGPGVKQAVSDVCFLDKKPGMCLAYMPRYYYNRETGQCEQFIYGGCQGNGNNFNTLEECEATCVPAPQQALDRPDCDKGPEPGMCRAYIPRFYYDQEDGVCKQFIYGGCDGNRNNFKTEEECYNKCGALQSPSTCDQPKKVGLCKAAFPRYYFNKETGKCEFFIYGGCGGNDNNFSTKEDCEAVCHLKIPDCVISMSLFTASRARRAPERCHQKPETGRCRAYIVRYYFDEGTGKCDMFIYGGCEGNDNNFGSVEECEETCSA